MITIGFKTFSTLSHSNFFIQTQLFHIRILTNRLIEIVPRLYGEIGLPSHNLHEGN